MDDPFKALKPVGGSDDPFKGLKPISQQDRQRAEIQQRSTMAKTRSTAIEFEYQQLLKDWKQPTKLLAPGVYGNTNRWGRIVTEPLTPQDVNFLRTLAKQRVQAQEQSTRNGGAQIGPIPEYRRRESELQFKQLKEKDEAGLRRSGVYGKGQQAVQQLTDMEPEFRRVAEPIARVGRIIGEGAAGPTILGKFVPGYKEFAGQAVGSVPEQVLRAPMVTYKTFQELTDPSVSAENKLRSAGDFTLNVVGLLSIGADDIAKGLAWTLFKIGSKSQKAEMAVRTAIREALNSGIKASEIEGYLTKRMIDAGKLPEGAISPPPEARGQLGKKSGQSFAKPTIAVKPKNAIDVPPTTAIDVTEEVAARRALPAPQRQFTPKELPGYEAGETPKLAKQAFINGAWRERTQGLIADLDRLIETQSGAGRQYGPIRRELQRSIVNNTPHPSVLAELEDVWKAQNARPTKTKAAAKIETPNAKETKIAPKSNRPVEGRTAEAQAEVPGSAKPDPQRTESQTFEVPPKVEAPVEAPQVKQGIIPKGGRESTATTPDLKRTINTREELVEMDDLITSHGIRGEENPMFPQSIQNRDRGRPAAIDQAKERASALDPNALIEDFKSTDRGSPIIGGDNVVISGNGRVISLRMAREQFGPKYEAYRKALAERFPEAAEMKNPVLVRRVTDELDEAARTQLAEASNQPSVARMSPFEEAANDSRSIPDDFVDRFKMRGKTIEAALASPENQGLIKSILGKLPPNERAALFDSSGTLSEPGRARVARAILHKIFGDDAKPILEKAFEEGDFSKRIMGGLEQAAGDLALLTKAGNAVSDEMRSKIAQALKYADEAMTQKKTSPSMWFDQGSLEYRDPGAMSIARAFVEAKSKEQVASIAGRLARAADDSSGGMFADEVGFATADDAIDAILKAEPKEAAGLFPNVEAFREASTVYGGGMPSGKRGGAMRIPNLMDPVQALWMAVRQGKTISGMREFFTAYLGNAFDIVKAAGPSGKRIAQDMERVMTEAAAQTANYGIRLKEVIRANFGRFPGLNPTGRRSLGLVENEFNDMVSKIERGERLTAKEARVWRVWTEINEELAGLGEQRGVLIERLVGSGDFKELVGRKVSFVRDGLTRNGIVESVEGGMLIRTAEGRFRLKYGESFWSGSIADPSTYFPRELKQGILEKLADEGSAEAQRAAKHLIEKGLATDAAQARSIINQMIFPGDIVVDSPVMSRLRMPRTGNLLPDEFYDRNFAKIAEKHIARAALDIAATERWGQDFSKLTKLIQEIPGGRSAKERVKEVIETGIGMRQAGPASRLVAAEGGYQALTKLSGLQTAIIQGSQLASNIGILGPKATIKGLWDVLKSAVTDRRLIHEIKLSGVIDEDILALQGFEDIGGVTKGIVNTGLALMKAVDGQLRLVSARSGLAAARGLLDKVKVSGKVIENNAAYRALSEWFQFTDEDIIRMKGGGMSQSDRLMAMRGGVKTQITTRTSDIPFHVNQVPALRMLWRFKTFAYGQAKLFSWAAKEASRGNAVPLIRLAASAAIVGEGIVSLKQEFLQWATGVESKRETLKETADKGWQALAQRAWDNVVETGTFGIYTNTWEMVSPDSPPYKKELALPAKSTAANLFDAILYGSKTEGDFLQKLEAAGMSFTDKEVVIARQLYKRSHEGRTYRQANPLAKDGE